PIAECDQAGACTFLNQAAQQLFAGSDGAARREAFFAGAETLCRQLHTADSPTLQREVPVGTERYLQHWQYVPATAGYRVFAMRMPAARALPEAGEAERCALAGRMAQRTEQLQLANAQLRREIAERQAVEQQVRYSAAIIKLANRYAERAGYLRAIVRFIRRLTGCQAVGVRLAAADGTLPLAAARGFAPAFLAAERTIDREKGACICARLFRGERGPWSGAATSPYGSVLYDGLLCSVQPGPAADCDRCRDAGLGTLVIIPVYHRSLVVATLLIADPRAYRLRPEMLALLESLVPLLGEVINRFNLYEQVRAANEMLERIFASTHICLVYLDRDFNFIRVNQAYAAIEGKQPEYFTGRNHFALYPDAENQAIFARVLAGGTPANYYAKPFAFPQHPEWGLTYWDWSLHPVRSPEGKVEGLLFCLVDVTKRHQAEQQLHEMQRELHDTQRLADIGMLAAMVAHELRNPLAAVKLAAYNIRRKAPGELLAGHLASIESKVADSEKIINNLLFYSRIRQAQHESCDLAAILRDCADGVRARCSALQPAVALSADLPEQCPLTADALQLRELFTNLLDNAVDAMQEKCGEVAITMSVAGDQVTVTVADTGAGIPETNLPRIFDAFFTTKTAGTGLGLAICRRIITNHHGTIAFSSQPGQGTTVTVTLPYPA
ncbi:MAG TPA: ATP-binding protein, partial [bacterium]|nr:ATP-binding protein [bacterium]